MINEKWKRVSISSVESFDKLLLKKLHNYDTSDALYYSLLLEYVIPYDKNFDELNEKKINWKPLYGQKDLLSLNEKVNLFIKEKNKSTSATVNFYYTDIKNQYMELLRLDKVTPHLKSTYQKK
jgi:hypothetical protein